MVDWNTFLNGRAATPNADPGLAALGVQNNDASPGLFSILSTLGAQISAAAPDASPAARLAVAGGGGGARASSGASGGESAAKASLTELYKYGKALGLGGNDLLNFTANPEEFAKARAVQQYGVHNAAPGETTYNLPGQTPGVGVVAPKLVDHDGQYGTQYADRYAGTGTALPSYADQTGQQNAQTALQRLAEEGRHNLVDEGQGAQRIGIERGNLGVAQNRLAMEAGGGGEASSLSPSAIQQLAESVVGGGQLPSLGVGKNAAAAKVAILNRVGEIQQAGGIDGYNALTNRATNKANSGALVKLTSQREAMQTAADAALSTFDQAIAHAKATNSAGSGLPFLSGVLQDAQILGAHNPDTVKFKNLLEDGSNEYAKVIAGNTGSAGSSDSARHEAMARLNIGMTLPELMKGREAVKQAMDAKLDAQNKQIDLVKSRLGTSPAAQPKAQVNQQLIQQSARAPKPGKDPILSKYGL